MQEMWNSDCMPGQLQPGDDSKHPDTGNYCAANLANIPKLTEGFQFVGVSVLPDYQQSACLESTVKSEPPDRDCDHDDVPRKFNKQATLNQWQSLYIDDWGGELTDLHTEEEHQPVSDGTEVANTPQNQVVKSEFRDECVDEDGAAKGVVKVERLYETAAYVAASQEPVVKLESPSDQENDCPDIKLETEQHCIKNEVQEFSTRAHCDNKTALSLNLVQHASDDQHRHETANEIYKCMHLNCQYDTRIKTNLKEHIEATHQDKCKYRCPHPNCRYKTAKRRNFTDHTRRKHPEPSVRMYECTQPGCSYKTAVLTEWKLHKARKHPSSSGVRYECAHCSYTSVVKKYLTQHVANRHQDPSGGVYKCLHPDCRYRTVRKTYLKKHVDCKHPDPRSATYECPHLDCGYKTVVRMYLQQHLANKHPDPSGVWYECPYDNCGYRTATKRYFGYHMRNKHGARVKR